MSGLQPSMSLLARYLGLRPRLVYVGPSALVQFHELVTRDFQLANSLSRRARIIRHMPADSQTVPLVGVIMGSKNDYTVMRAAVEILREFRVPHEVKVVSAHRTPDLMFKYAETAASRGLRVIIAGAGGAAHLPGMVAAKTVLPVLGVPIPATALQGLDSLLSIVQRSE